MKDIVAPAPPAGPVTDAAGPIFLLGLQRGGTNQLLSALRSHPDVRWPDGELHELFRPRSPREYGWPEYLRRLAGYAPLAAAAGDPLSPHRPPRPGALDGWRGRWLARELEAAAARNVADVAAYKRALAERGFVDDTGPGRRLLVKLVNHTVGLAPALARLYPSARFVGVIRHAEAVCEGRIARGGSLEDAAAAYAYVGDAFARLEAAGAPLLVVRFEDVVADADAVFARVFAFCGLDPARLRGLCLYDKGRVHDAAGRVVGMTKEASFYPLGEASRHMRRDANAGSASRLTAAQRAEIARRCGETLARHGYR